jgi:hypothetical protein
MHGTMAKIVDAVRSTFVPFSRTEAPAVKAAQANGKVEYATGLVVTAAGHIVTPRHAIDGCETIVVAGLGNAEAVADDQTKGLALLRVYGSRELVPLSFAGEAAAGPELTLVGIADPKAQSGGSAASTARAKLGTASGDGRLRPIENVPAAGFSGAAALDGKQVVGMVQLKPQIFAEAGAANLPPPAAVVPAEILREFLETQGVRPTLGTSGSDEAKASLVRVICVRQ